jgi:hypothetical protein
MWRIRRGTAPGVECTVDLGTQFCERCGRDRDSFASARNEYRDCPACGAACCADCWNLVDGACLACAPFRLVESTTRPRIVVAPQAVTEMPAAADPYADLRGSAPPLDAWDATWGAAHQRPKETQPAGVARPASVPTNRPAQALDDSVRNPARARGRRAGRVGMAAGGAWVVVAMLAVVALGATPGARVPAPTEDTPRVVPSPAATTAPSPPAETPRATRAPRATPRPTPRARPADPGVTAPRTTPRPTKRPVKPIVVPPPPPPPPPTPIPEPVSLVPPASAPELSPAIFGASPAATVP